MHVCLISVEIFAWGKYGGFGRATRIIGRELAARGVQVTAIVPRRKGQKPVEILDGIEVKSFKPWDLGEAWRLFRETRADVFHSQEPSLGTWMAMQANRDKKHIITFRDTRSLEDWRLEINLPSLNQAQVLANWLYEDSALVHQAVRRADAWYCAAQMLVPKARQKYRLHADPLFLPTPVVIPPPQPKAPAPAVCFVSRWDRRKRPELFFDLAAAFPQVRFTAVGKSRSQPYEAQLRRRYGHHPNLQILGFIDQFSNDQLNQVYSQSWIMVNPAAREGLPNTFIEAAAHGCALLSSVDPDQFASRFGCHVEKDDFAGGLRWLLENDRWQALGSLARQHIQENFASETVIPQYLSMYNRLVSTR